MGTLPLHQIAVQSGRRLVIVEIPPDVAAADTTALGTASRAVIEQAVCRAVGHRRQAAPPRHGKRAPIDRGR